jgi:hypothetical protein
MESDLTKLKKTELTKIAKKHKLNGYSKLNKAELVQFILTNKLKKRVRRLVVPLDEVVDNLNKLDINSESPSPDSLNFESLNLEPEPKKQRINPIEELNKKLSEIIDDPNGYKEASLRNCYAYRTWLWTVHNLTYEEEMERVDKILKEE